MRLKKTGMRWIAFFLLLCLLSGSRGFTAIVSASDFASLQTETATVTVENGEAVEGSYAAGKSQIDQISVQGQIDQISVQSLTAQTSDKSQGTMRAQSDDSADQTAQTEGSNQLQSSVQATAGDQSQSSDQATASDQNDQATAGDQNDQTTAGDQDRQATASDQNDQTTAGDQDRQITASDQNDQSTADDQDDQTTGSESDSQTDQETLTEEDSSSESAGETGITETVPELTRIQTLSGRKLYFSQNTEKGSYLSSDTLPQNVHIRGKKSSIMIYWDYPVKQTDIDGYIILRKKGSSAKYTQIARVNKKKTYYKDSKSLKKNCFYSYVLVSYKKNTGLTISGQTTSWAGGVITKSKKTNVYSATISNTSRLSGINKGSTLTLKASFAKKAAYKSVRWSSSNPSVISIDSKGKVKALATGTAVITAKFASGYKKSFKATCIIGGTATAIVNVLKSWLGYSEKNGKHKEIIDIYNAYGDLPLNYAVTYRDAWCDTCLSAAAIVSGNVNTIGRECGVRRHVDIFKKKKIWIENGEITPKPGYIIVYSWGKSTQPNNSGANHIGLVIAVKNNTITTIEGNYDDQVKKRKIPVGWGYIRGYAKPKYK